MGYSQGKLADYLGVTQQAISKYENGDREPDIDTIIKLSQLFDVSSDYLLGGEEILFIEDDDLSAWCGKLLRPSNDGSFKQNFVKMLSTLDEKDWLTVEKMFHTMTEL